MIHIITAVHNRYIITEAFVKKLLEQSAKDWNLILIDDGSTDGTADMVKKYIPKAVVLKGDGNLWWGGALHEAYKYVNTNIADEDYIFISNDDVDFSNDYIEKAIAILKKNPNTLLTGCGISKQTGEQVDGAVRFDFLKGGGTQGCEEENFGNCASTRSIFLRASDMKKIGGFHPVLLPHYGSDYEWTIRANRKKNMKILCVSSLKYEVNEATTGDHASKDRTLKQIFQKRSTSNPIYKTTFCFLASPWGLKTASIVCQCWRTLFPKKKQGDRYD